jgi:hypothetical protein
MERDHQSVSALQLIATVAWPLTVPVIGVMFRRPITEALAAATGRVKAKRVREFVALTQGALYAIANGV